MLDFLGAEASDRELRLFAAACCRSVWAWVSDERLRGCVEAAESFADGLSSEDEFKSAADEAWDAVMLPYQAPDAETPVSAWYAARAAAGLGDIRSDSAPEVALYTAWKTAAVLATDGLGWCDPSWDEVLRNAWAAHRREIPDADAWPDLRSDAAYEVGWDSFTAFPGWASERREQARRLRDLFGNPFRPVILDPTWLCWNDGATVKIAQSLYDGRRFTELPILADALEDAGCTDRAVIEHCRAGGGHVRGCWVVDLLLGKK
jgi:hypothetical protein